MAKRKSRNGQGPSSPSDHVTALRNHPLLCELSAYSAITKLVDETWNHGEDLKASYKHGEPHEHVKITHVFKVKNGKLLEQYNNNNKKAQVTQMNDMPNELKQNPIITANVGNVQCDQEKEVKLNVGNPNEVYLFHGTKLEHVTGIIEHGFDPKRAKRKRFGTAIYMTESPEKADQYTGRYPDNYTFWRHIIAQTSTLHKTEVEIFINIWLSSVKLVYFPIPNKEIKVTTKIN